MRNLKVFTLLELLAVFSVVAILFGISIPKLKGLSDQSKTEQVRRELKALQSGIESYRTFFSAKLSPSICNDVCGSTLMLANPLLLQYKGSFN